MHYLYIFLAIITFTLIPIHSEAHLSAPPIDRRVSISPNKNTQKKQHITRKKAKKIKQQQNTDIAVLLLIVTIVLFLMGVIFYPLGVLLPLQIFFILGIILTAFPYLLPFLAIFDPDIDGRTWLGGIVLTGFFAIFGIGFLIWGLVAAIPALWIFGTAIIGAFVLFMLIFFFYYLLK